MSWEFNLQPGNRVIWQNLHDNSKINPLTGSLSLEDRVCLPPAFDLFHKDREPLPFMKV